jgi:phospholipid/cholesterol/gamma-HCH transport system substrate-binding protein
MEEKRLEMKVGALVLAAVIGVLALLFLMGELDLTSSTQVTVEFSHTGNVVKGAPVKMGGVPVGRVQRIILTPDRRDARGDPMPITMELSVEPSVKAVLREDAAVTVATVGLLGEPYLELHAGSNERPALAEGKAIRGLDAPRLDLVANRLAQFLESASKILEQDPEALAKLVANVTSLSGNLDAMLIENKPALGDLAKDLSAAARDLRLLSQQARAQLSPGGAGNQLLEDAAATAKLLREDVPRLSGEAGKVLGGLAALSSGFTPEDGQKLRQAIHKYAAAGEKLEAMATRGDRILARLEAGEGTVGGAMKDPALYNELKELVTDLRKHPWKLIWKD